MRLGSFELEHPVLVAPMAGITDQPYRKLCREHGAALAYTEMVSSRPEHRNSRETRYRLSLAGEVGPIAVQIVGTDPAQLAEMARFSVDQGAELIDINMGCPSKKVCNQLAGSALMGDEVQVGKILNAVVSSVPVPVTLKMRTGLSRSLRNAVTIGLIAQDAGVQMLTVHGRTRQCRFKGPVEYETIARVKHAVSIPVIANGDIDSPEKARTVLDRTGADGVMVGRSAQGRPWLFRQIRHFLATGEKLKAPPLDSQVHTMLKHLRLMYEFYGTAEGAVLTRKHVVNYLKHMPGTDELRQRVVRLGSASDQMGALKEYFYDTDTPLKQAA